MKKMIWIIMWKNNFNNLEESLQFIAASGIVGVQVMVETC